jgi:hypothetical protein
MSWGVGWDRVGPCARGRRCRVRQAMESVVAEGALGVAVEEGRKMRRRLHDTTPAKQVYS